MTIQNDAEKELLRKINQCDDDAFREIYDKYWLSLLNAAYKRLQNLQDAEEVVQDVFINLYERRSVLEVRGSLEAYLHTAVRYKVYNKFRDWIQLNKIYKIGNIEDSDHAVPAHHLVEFKDTEESFHKAVCKLPPKCKEVYLLSRNNELSNKQVAEKLGISINTVEKHIGRALQILRREMDQYRFGCYFLLLLNYLILTL